MREKIIELRKQKLTYKQIAEKLNCSLQTIKYHLIPNRREKHLLYNKKQSLDNPLAKKLFKYKKNHFNSTITTEDLLNKIGKEPKCYLTGERIDLSKPETYSFDHIIPLSRGGSCELDNLGLILSEVNQAKYNKTPEEFIEICKKVLNHARIVY